MGEILEREIFPKIDNIPKIYLKVFFFLIIVLVLPKK